MQSMLLHFASLSLPSPVKEMCNKVDMYIGEIKQKKLHIFYKHFIKVTFQKMSKLYYSVNQEPSVGQFN